MLQEMESDLVFSHNHGLERECGQRSRFLHLTRRWSGRAPTLPAVRLRLSSEPPWGRRRQRPRTDKFCIFSRPQWEAIYPRLCSWMDNISGLWHPATQ